MAKDETRGVISAEALRPQRLESFELPVACESLRRQFLIEISTSDKRGLLTCLSSASIGAYFQLAGKMQIALAPFTLLAKISQHSA